MTHPCPPPHRWRALLADDVSPADQAVLSGHLELCPACQQTLEECAAHRSTWDAARSLRQRSQEPVLTALIDRLKTDADDHAAELPLDFLDPSERSESLGRIHNYEILDEIGRGGMGVVLKALDPGLHRVCAIKVLAPQLAVSGTARKRFTREARAAAAIGHENVVTIHAVEEFKGLPYLVMQYVAGPSLQDRLTDGGPLPVAEILRIGTQTAAGLAAAHAQGLVHRDVKPANILLENGVERVKLTDFSLARTIDDARVTQTGVVTGTPPFMAPEQARGEPVDHRSDLFSLGSVLYALCTGRPPFRGANPLDVLRKVSETTPERIRSLNPEVPAWLEAIVVKLMAKDPAERFQSAAEVAGLLERCLAHWQQPTTVPLPAEVVAKRRWLLSSPLSRLCGRGVGGEGAVRRTTLTPGPSPPKPGEGRVFKWAAVGGLIAAVLLAVTTLRLKTTDGWLVVELDDPKATVTVDGTDIVVTGAGVQEFRLKAGDYTPWKLKDGRKEPMEIVSIKQGEKTPLKVTFEPGPRVERTTAVKEQPSVPVLSDIPHLGRLFTQGQQAAAELEQARAAAAAARANLAAVQARTADLTRAAQAEKDRAAEYQRYLTALKLEKDELDQTLGPNHPKIKELDARIADLQRTYGVANAASDAALNVYLEKQLAGLQIQKEQALATLGPNHPKIKELDNQIVAARKMLADHAAASPGRRTQPDRVIHTVNGGITSAAFSPDGARLYTADRIGDVYGYDVLSGKTEFKVAAEHKVLALSPDGKTLAAAGTGHYVGLYDAKTGKTIETFKGQPAEYFAVAFSPDGKTVAAGGSGPEGTGGLLELWDVGAEKAKTMRFPETVRALASEPAGEGKGRLAVGLDATSVHVVNPVKAKLICTMPAQNGPISRAAFSPDGQWLATTEGESKVNLWRWDRSGVWATFAHPTGRVTSVRFSPDNSRLVTAGIDGTARLWDVRSHNAVTSFGPADKSALAVALFTPDGNAVVTAGEDKLIRVWESSVPGSPPPSRRTPPAADGARSPQQSAADQLARAQEDAKRAEADLAAAKQRVDAATRMVEASRDDAAPYGLANPQPGVRVTQPRRSFATKAGEVSSAVFSPDGKTLVVADWNGAANAFDFATGRLRYTIASDKGGNRFLAVSPDGQALAAAGTGQTIHLFDLTTGEVRQTFRGQPAPYYAVTFTPDGKTLAAGGCGAEGKGGLLEVWDLSSGRRRTVEFADPVMSLAVPPGREDRLAVGTDGPDVRMIYPSTARQEYALAQPGHIRALAFSPDDRWLATGGDDGAVRLWDWQGGTSEPRATLTGGPRRVSSLQFSADGKLLLIARLDGTARLWDVASRRVIATFAASTSESGMAAALFTPDGKAVVTAGDDGVIRVWEVPQLTTGKVEAVPGTNFQRYTGTVRDGATLELSGDVQRREAEEKARINELHADAFKRMAEVTQAQADAYRKLLSGSVTEPRRTIKAGGSVAAAAFAADGQRLIVAGTNGSLRGIDFGSGRESIKFAGTADHRFLAVSRDGKLLATTGNGPTIRLWDAATGKRTHEFNTRADAVIGLAFRGDATTLAVATDSGKGDEVRLLDDPYRAFGARIAFGKGPIVAMACAPAGFCVAVATEDGTVHVTGDHSHSDDFFKSIPGSIRSLVFSPGGDLLAVAGGDVFTVSSLKTGEGIQYHTHAGPVASLRFSPDGRFLVAALRDGTAQLFALLRDPKGKPQLYELTKFAPNAGQMSVAEFSPDGRSLITAGQDGVIRVWDLGPLAAAKAVAAPEPGHPQFTVSFSDGGTVEPDGTLKVNTTQCQSCHRATPTLEVGAKMDFAVFTAKHVKASDAANTLKELAGPGVVIRVDERTNTVLVHTTKATRELLEILEKLDRPADTGPKK